MVIFMLFDNWYEHALKALLSTKLWILSCHSWACTVVLYMELKALHVMNIGTNNGRFEYNNSFSLKSILLCFLNALANWMKVIRELFLYCQHLLFRISKSIWLKQRIQGLKQQGFVLILNVRAWKGQGYIV